MRIQHNIMAMNAYRNYNGNTKALSGNLEKLSSGYKINRAGDDAAGLAISEKMRAQITGLEAAQKNVKDGISLVKTGEGAMQEIQDMLNRMDYLATQSANGTYDNDVDRANLQKEVNALKTEINRIADSANFNGIKLLDGSLAGKSQASNVTVTSSTAVKGKYTTSAFVNSADISGLKSSDIGKAIDYTVTWKDATGTEQTHTMTLTFQGNGEGAVDATTKSNNFFTNANGDKIYLGADGKLSQTNVTKELTASLNADKAFAAAFDTTDAASMVFDARQEGSAGSMIVGIGINVEAGMSMKKEAIYDTTTGDDTVTVTNAPYDSMHRFGISGVKTAVAADTTADKIAQKVFEIDGHKFLLDGGLTDNALTAVDSDVTIIKVAGAVYAAADAEKVANEISRVTGLKVAGYKANGPSDIIAGDVVFTEGKLNLAGKSLTLQIGDTPDKFNQMDVKIGDMHTAALGISDIDIGNQEGAAAAINKIKAAINQVSSVRGDLGAIQNRLDHTANNLSVMAENIQDAESTIRDTDVANEMMSYVKNNILVQSAQAMLAQANQVPQGVLQLLG